MDDRQGLLERYAPRAAKAQRAAEPAPPEAMPDYQPSSAVSGSRNHPELMLELRFRPGNAVALNYGLLVSSAFDPSTGVTLEFTNARVRIQGRNLGEIWRALVQHRLSWIQEHPMPRDDLDDAETVVTAIAIEPV